MLDNAKINEAGEIISLAVRQSRATGKTDLNFALAILAGEILMLRDSLRECVAAVESGSGDLPEPVMENVRLALDLLPPAAQPEDQSYAASES